VSAATDLYRAVVVEHGQHPRNLGALATATHVANGDNPLCGDALEVAVALAGERLVELRFTGESCAIATASASLMTERLAGVTLHEARALADAMETLCATGVDLGPEVETALGDLVVFAGVHRHPVRVACATLAWRTLRAALGI
jgi:nitrogen fixation protein NifU and related proteins